MDHRPPPPHVSPKGMWVTKVIFRIQSAINSFILIGLTAYVTVDWYNAPSYYYTTGTPLVMFVPPAAIGAIWDIAEAICIFARRGHRGIHPGAIVAIDLLLWLGFVAATVLYGLYFFITDVYSSSSLFYGDLMSLAYISRATLAFGILEVLFHLILFIFGCHETAIRNRRPPVIVYPAAVGGPQMMPGQHPNSQYGPPIMLTAGQAPPAGYVAYAYGPTDTEAQPKPTGYSERTVSPLPQEPSPVHTLGGDWRNSTYETSASPQPGVQKYPPYSG